MSPALHELALAAGVEARYWDGLGVERSLGEATAAALLDALGFDAAGDCAAQRAALDAAAFRVPLAPACVVRADGEGVALALPEAQGSARLAWRIDCADGTRREGWCVPAQRPPLAVREIDGTRHARWPLPLPADLPLGYHRLRLAAPAAESALIVAPARCYVPPALAAGGRCWGFAVQLYTLRSAANWGIGDFADLAQLATAAGAAGAAFIGLNPLHARHLVHPDEASPYAPSSRLFLDPLYLALEAVDGYAQCAAAQAAVAAPAFRAALARARAAPLVDYAAVAALKLPLLEQVFADFRAAGASEAFDEFRRTGGEPLARFAEFEALRGVLAAQGHAGGWREWPAPWRDPAGAALAAFRATHAAAIDFQAWLQWQAAQQLARAAAAARAAGMTLGLYRDLAVGAAHDSAETWSAPDLFAHDVSVGAPPDLLNRQGQSWGLPPWKPAALAARGYAPFAELLAANMREAGALRIDHVMALTRLFWIPAGLPGADGGYVRNALDALLAVLALESVRHRCMVIGEDLGAVPDGLRARLREAGLLSYRVLLYERHWQGDGEFCHPHEYPPQSLATVATHDMPTLAEYWAGGDIARRAQIGLLPDAGACAAETARRAAERAGLLRVLDACGLPPADAAAPGAVIESLHALLARTHAMLAAVQLDDLAGETAPVNIPGTYREYPNWRRKLALTLEELTADPRWARLAALMRAAGRASAA